MGQRTFKFGGGERLVDRRIQASSSGCWKRGHHQTVVVESDIPLLLSRKAMKMAGVMMDLESDTVRIFGKHVALNLTTLGHYCIHIDRAEKI